MRRGALGVAALLALSACDDDASSDDAGVLTDPIPSACTTHVLFTAEGTHLKAPGLAVNGETVLLSWIDTEADLSATPTARVQRLTLAGEPVGPEIVVDVFTDDNAVAAVGDGFVHCYGLAQQQLACQQIGPASAPMQGLFDYASLPHLASGNAGTLLVDVGAIYIHGDVRVRPIDAAGLGGTPTTIASFGAVAPIARLVATASGYAVVTGVHRGDLTVTRLDPTGSPAGSAVKVQSLWRGYDVAVAASGDDLVLAWGDFVDQRVVIQTVSAMGVVGAAEDGGLVGPRSGMQAVGDAKGVVFTWPDPAGYIGLRAFAPDGRPRAAPRMVRKTGWPDNPHAIVAVTDGLLVATAIEPLHDAMELLHVDCGL